MPAKTVFIFNERILNAVHLKVDIHDAADTIHRAVAHALPVVVLAFVLTDIVILCDPTTPRIKARIGQIVVPPVKIGIYAHVVASILNHRGILLCHVGKVLHRDGTVLVVIVDTGRGPVVFVLQIVIHRQGKIARGKASALKLREGPFRLITRALGIPSIGIKIYADGHAGCLSTTDVLNETAIVAAPSVANANDGVIDAIRFDFLPVDGVIELGDIDADR